MAGNNDTGKEQAVAPPLEQKAADDGEESTESETGESEEEDEEDEEPKLKYARLTSHLGSVYRNADATSAFMVAGDKMV